MPALDLKAVREALKSVVDAEGGAILYEGEEDEIGTRSCCRVPSYQEHYHDCWFIASREALAALDSHLSLSEYDRAVSDLAKYLPDGFIAQDKDGEAAWFNEKPEQLEWFWGFRKNKTGECKIIRGLQAPKCADWRTSLRLIRGGVVQGGG